MRQFLSSQQLAVFILDEIQRSVITSVCLCHWNGHTSNVRKTPDKISVCSDFTDIFPQKTGLNIHINRGCRILPILQQKRYTERQKHGLTCRRRSLVFLVILSMAEFRGSPFSFLPVCQKEAEKLQLTNLPANAGVQRMTGIFHT